jgi:hypothetical protein
VSRSGTGENGVPRQLRARGALRRGNREILETAGRFHVAGFEFYHAARAALYDDLCFDAAPSRTASKSVTNEHLHELQQAPRSPADDRDAQNPGRSFGRTYFPTAKCCLSLGLPACGE